MARLAGMTLRERWSGWRREPLTAASDRLGLGEALEHSAVQVCGNVP
jgi:hypothetical protein